MDTTRSKITEPFKIAEDWNVQSKKLKEKFSQLTDEDLSSDAGKESELLTQLETQLNKRRQEVIGLIKNVEIKTFKAL